MKDPQTKTIADATLVDFSNNLITIIASQALPPGSRVQFQVDVNSQLSPVSLSGKVVSVRRSDKGNFILSIRLHSLTREQSLALRAKSS